jgi:hypothetical protein
MSSDVCTGGEHRRSHKVYMGGVREFVSQLTSVTQHLIDKQ